MSTTSLASSRTQTLVKKFERILKMDVVYILKNGGWMTLGQIFTSTTSLLMAFVFARYLSKETYGTYRFVVSIVGLLSVTSLFGMAHAVIRASALGADRTLVRGTLMRMRWSLVGSIIALFLAGYEWIQNEPLLAVLFIMVALLLPFIEPLQTPWAFLTGKKAFKSHTIARTSTLVIATLSAITMSFFADNILLLVCAFYFPNVILRIGWMFWIKKRYVTNNIDQEDTYTLGKHFSAMTILTSAAEHLDKVILYGMMGPVEVATYSLAMIPVQQSFVYIGNIVNIAMPKFAQRTFEDIRMHLPGKLMRMMFILTIFAGILILIIPFFYSIFFPAYPESILFAQIAAIAIVFQSHQLIPFAFMAHARTKDLYMIRMVQPAIQLTLLITLLPILGILGAVLAFVLAHSIGMVFQWWLLMKSSSK